jgi:hypothetical protein
MRIGALVTVLTIALDPFAQQLVQIQEKPKSIDPDDQARASIQVAYAYRQTGDGYVTTYADYSGRSL